MVHPTTMGKMKKTHGTKWGGEGCGVTENLYPAGWCLTWCNHFERNAKQTNKQKRNQKTPTKITLKLKKKGLWFSNFYP